MPFKPCGWPSCPAVITAGREFCPVHKPDKVLERAKQIVHGNFARVTGLSTPNQRIFDLVLAAIIRDLEGTV